MPLKPLLQSACTVKILFNIPVHDSAKTPSPSLPKEFSSHGCRRTLLLGCADLMKEKREACALMHQKLNMNSVVDALPLKWMCDNKSKCLMVGIETGGIHPCYGCTAYRWDPVKKKKVANGWYPCNWKDGEEDGVEDRTTEKCIQWNDDFRADTNHMTEEAALKLQSNYKNQVNRPFKCTSDPKEPLGSVFLIDPLHDIVLGKLFIFGSDRSSGSAYLCLSVNFFSILIDHFSLGSRITTSTAKGLVSCSDKYFEIGLKWICVHLYCENWICIQLYSQNL